MWFEVESYVREEMIDTMAKKGEDAPYIDG